MRSGPESHEQREARAMAKLSHPNVVTLYEVGEHEGQLFLAMEFITGPDLSGWLRERGPAADWRTVLDMFIQAGRGLAAAHRVGLVHRDFKPANVFVDDDGRVRVGDFGLARQRAADGLATERHSGREGLDGGPPATARDLTATGALLGTPAYMAPEQFAGEETDARTDQFAFCIALWEALQGARPFAGATFAELMLHVTTGRRSASPAGNRAPAWVCRVLDRGLSLRPDARYPDMEALLAALQADPTRWRRALAGSALAALTLAAGFGAHQYREAQQIAACEADGASIATVWNEAARTRLRDGLLATGVAYAQTTAERVLPYFATYAAEWQQARTDACLDARVRDAWTEGTLERSVWCLDERRMQLEALLAGLSRASATSVQHAVAAAAQLPRIGPCRDEHRLAAAPPLPSDRQRVLALLETLSQAAARQAAGVYGEGLERAHDALATAEALGSPPLIAAARLRSGLLLTDAGNYLEAEKTLEGTYFQAAAVGAWEVAAEAAGKLTYIVGYLGSRPEEGQRWSRHADVALALLGPDDEDLLGASALNDRAVVLNFAGAHDEARALHERVLATRERVLGPDHPLVANSLNNLAATYEEQGAYDQAKALQERALAIRERALGPDHPDIALSLNNLAAVHEVTGAYAEARALHERAVAIRERALGPDHPDLAISLDNLGVVHYFVGAHDEARAAFARALAIREKALHAEHLDIALSLNNLAGVHLAAGSYDEARAGFERVIAIREKALGPDHPEVAMALDNLASVHRLAGRPAQAKPLQDRALAIVEKALGPDHPTIATILNNLAHTHRMTGAYAEAKALYERGLTIAEKALGPEHPLVPNMLTGLAEVLLARHRPADAVALAERAVRIGETSAVPPDKLASSCFALARALWGAPLGLRDRGRARTLARQALDTLRTTKGRERERAAVEAFLADIGAP
ncbi:serine/threonine-protein kinase [Nannocystis sp. SCPEA4]|uniref:serine/threonine-protein kinase n=1 Tax=Nannocystis sp. SCPEA4 TaxID=2996787 RepID=UPI00226E5BD0|nr:serine/threonine-protein kinase [Nannocystis sp. SCPEA4]MCY1054719.1 serine/threonine-protein kinase [Nannocystis sp. SCPEA4]